MKPVPVTASADPLAVREIARRYAAGLTRCIATALSANEFTEDPQIPRQFPLETGVVYARALVHRGTSDELRRAISQLPTQPPAGVTDRLGHTRTIYRPLLLYSWLRAAHLAGIGTDPLAAATDAWCGALHAPVQATLAQGPLPASRGAEVAEAAWSALALRIASERLHRPDWSCLAREWFHHLAARQQPHGPLLTATASDNPEAHWFFELATLHPLATYALQTGDPTLRQAVHRAAHFHVAETQPDHATNQPWALFAFLWHPDTVPLADALLHAATAHGSGATPSALTLMLLADALYCLRTLTETDPL